MNGADGGEARHGYALVVHHEDSRVGPLATAAVLAMPGCLAQVDDDPTGEKAVALLNDFIVDRYLAHRKQRGAKIVPPDLPDWIGSLAIHNYHTPGCRMDWERVANQRSSTP